MISLESKKKRRNIITASAVIVVAICILILLVFATNSNDNTEEVQTASEDSTHLTEVPEGYIGIYNADDLANVNNDLATNYILMNDIDLSGIDFDVIGNSSSSAFSGIFEGNNYTISNLNINSSNQYVGLFGYVNGGTVKNLTVENVGVIGDSNTAVKSFEWKDFTVNTYNGKYGFYKNGTSLIPNNTGTSSTTADSFIELDLTGDTSVYKITVNAEVSSEEKYDFGYATVSKSNLTPAYSDENGRIMSISGTVSAKDYSINVPGGQIYYLHLGYRKDGSLDKGNDIVKFNSLKVEKTSESEYSNVNEGTTVIDGGNTGEETINIGGIGGVVGYIIGGTIENVAVIGTSTVESPNTIGTNYIYAGGIVGYATGTTISNTHSEGTITTKATSGATYAGGIAGYATGTTTINNSYSTANIATASESGVIYTGGLVGILYRNVSSTATVITNSYSTGSVTANSTSGAIYAGGIVGEMHGYSSSYYVTIEKNYAIGNVNATSESGEVYAGGLIGYSYYVTINNTYATGDVTANSTGTKYVAGLIGKAGYYTTSSNYANATITYSYAVGKVNATGNVGGLTGYTRGTITNSYWSPETTGQLTSSGGTGLLFQDMLYQNSYTSWDFEDVWTIEEGDTLPYLKDLAKPEQVNKANYTYIEYEGQGTQDNPYIIETEEQLQGMKNGLTAHYKLGYDIEITNEFEPIGLNATYSFKGSLDGDGHTISNLNINSSNQNIIGLFGYISGGTVKNLTIENANIESTSTATSYIGGIAGYITGGIIDNVAITGTSNIGNPNNTGTNHIYAGGIVGYATGTTISNTHSEGTITTKATSGATYAGGIAGYATGTTTINNSYSTVDIATASESGVIYTGGLVGILYRNVSSTATVITNSYSTGSVTANSTSGAIYAGGIVGEMYGCSSSYYVTIEKNYAIGNVNATSESGEVYAGGLIGYSYYVTINNTYATGDVTANSTGTKYVAGLIGKAGYYTSSSSYAKATITNSYAVGKVTANTNGTTHTGGLIASAYGTRSNLYWSPETTGQLTSSGGTALLFQDMLYQNSYTNWDFETIWTIEAGNTLPYLKDLAKPEQINQANYTYIEYEGQGTQDNPYIIETEEQLQGMKNGLTVHYKLGYDIVITQNFEPIGNATYPFKGSLDGDGHTISNLNIESSNQYVGLFGYINGGTVKNLTLENATVASTYSNSSNYAHVGVIAGYIASGTIENVAVIGESNIQRLEGTYGAYVGGIVGYTTGTTINNTHSEGAITTTSESGAIYVGGIVGYSNGGTITNTYSIGNVSAISTTGGIDAGGLVGYNGSGVTVEKSYATGTVNVTSTSGGILAGGLIGYSYGGTITNTYATGDVTSNSTGTQYVAGLIGKAGYYYYSSSSGSTYVKATITNSYAVGKVTATGNVGGLTGYIYGTINNSYWSPETTGQLTTASAKGTALLFQDMLYADSYTNWDFDTIWEIDEGNTLPYLQNLGTQEQVDKANYENEYIPYYGKGNIDDPYIIEDETQLQGMKNGLTVHYKLGYDIEITQNFEPIGLNATYPFTGSLDGDGHTISNLNIESSNQYVGLFGYISGGTVKNLTLDNATITSTYSNYNNYAYVGGIAGYVTGGTIENVSVIGENNIQRAEEAYGAYVGGIVGYTNSTTAINNSNVEGAISAQSASGAIIIGGIVGYSNGGTITNTYSIGNVSAISTTGGIDAGGLVGYNGSGVTIEKSYATGAINVTSTSGGILAGGLIGYSYGGTITNTYAAGDVTSNSTGTQYVAGLIGKAGYYYYSSSSGSTYVKATITNSYAVGKVNATGNVGGLTGYIYGTINNSYWSPETTGQLTTASAKGTALLFQDMLHAEPYTDWDFTDVWEIEDGNTLPYLKNLAKPEQVNQSNYTYTTYEGNGTDSNPYLIRTEAQLQGMRNIPYAHYKLMNNIILTESFKPIGPDANCTFTGSLDGQGYTISNLQISADGQYAGLFGYIDGGLVQNLKLDNINVNRIYTTATTTTYVGGFAGYIKNGEIKNIEITGANSTVTAETKSALYIGGFAGQVDGGTTEKVCSLATVNATSATGAIYIGGLMGYGYKGTLNETYATGDVNATSTKGTIYAGGLIGQTGSLTTQDLYSIGKVNVLRTTGTVYVGGLVGYESSTTIKNAYAVGQVTVESTGTKNIGGLIGYASSGNVTDSYWSPEATGCLISATSGEKPLLMQEMIRKATYPTTWDFENTWEIINEDTLPYFKWMVNPEQVKISIDKYITYEGTGTEVDPYIITNEDQLQAIKYVPYAYYKLGNYISVNKDFEPIGQDSKTAFTGTLDGRDFAIYNLNINSSNQYVGLFGYVNGGTIKNLTLNNANVVSSYNSSSSSYYAYVGSIAGYIASGTIENVGLTEGSRVENTTGNYTYIGGLVGYDANETKINNSYAQATINANITTGYLYAGGIAGYATSASQVNIEETYSTGDINATSTKGTIYAGGLVGVVYKTSSTISNYNIANVFSTGDINATSTSGAVYTGGLIGYIDGYSSATTGKLNIDNAYAVGIVNASTTGNKYTGGLVGSGSYYTATDSYWSPETTGCLISATTEEQPLLIQQMVLQSTFDRAWDFDAIWAIEEGDTLPYLQQIAKPNQVNINVDEYVAYAGEGTEENPYIITNKEELQAIQYLPSAYYQLGCDIEVNGDFDVIGKTANTAFTGTFDGADYAINGLNINSNNQYVGLFGYVNGGTIKNVTLNDANIKSTYNTTSSSYYAYVGGIAGYVTDETIENVGIEGESFVENTVANYTYVGGLIGCNANDTVINKAYSQAKVNTNITTGATHIGGLIGQNNATVNNAYSTGKVTAESTTGTIHIGGLYGCTYKTTDTSYSTGEVSATSTSGAIYAGGFVGCLNSNLGTITNSFAIGEVDVTSTSGKVYAGGLIGSSSGGSSSNKNIVTNTYAVGKVSATTSGTKYVGGLIGNASNTTTTESYWSPKTTGQETSSSSGEVAKSIQELLYQTGYADTWDFDSVWTIEPDGASLAYLQDLPMPEGIEAEALDFETRVIVKAISTSGKALQGAKFIVKDANGTSAVNSDGNEIGDVTTNKNGTGYILNLTPGTYTVQEIEVPASYIVNTNTYTFTLTEEGKTVDASGNEINLNIESEQLKIEVFNKDIETDEGIGGAQFILYNTDGTKVIGVDGKYVTATTDSEGKATLTQMTAGTYVYKLDKAATGYKSNTTGYTVTIAEDGLVTFNEDNNGIVQSTKIGLKGIQIEVVDKDNPDIKIENARLEVSQTNASAEVKYYSEDLYTDENGIVDITDIKEYGKMLLELETFEMPLGYKSIQTKMVKYENSNTKGIVLDTNNISDDIDVTVDENTDTMHIIMYAERDTFDMNITVVDANNTNMILGNVQVSVTDYLNYTVSGTTNTDEALVLTPTKNTVESATYNITVDSAPIGYVNNLSQSITVTFDSKGNITNVVGDGVLDLQNTNNNAIDVTLKLERTAEFNKAYVTLYETDNSGKALKGATYDIHLTSGDGFDAKLTSSTDAQGRMNIEFYGNENISIALKQTSGVYGYKIDTEEKVVILNKVEDILELNEDLCSGKMAVSIINNEVYIELTNDRKEEKNALNIQAVYDKDNEMKLQNIPFTVTADEYSYSGVTDISGNIEIQNIPAQANTAQIYTITLGDLPSFTYDKKINEFKIRLTFDEYANISKVELLDDTEFVNVSYEELEDEEVAKHVANVQVEIGYKANINLYVIKQDEISKARVEGVIYNVTLRAHSNSTGKDVVSTVQKTTDSNGQFAITVPTGEEGDYLKIELTEVKTQNKYVLDKTTRTVTLDVNSSGLYTLESTSTDNITVDLENQSATNPYIAILENAKLKIDSSKSAELNINLDVSNSLGAKLGGVKYNIYEYIGNSDSYSKSFTVTTDATGKATQTVSINNTGIYTFKIVQQNTIVGHESAGTISARVRYENVDGEMKCQSFIVIKGNEYIIKKETKEVTTDDCYKYDMNLYILNKFKSTQITEEIKETENEEIEPIPDAKTCFVKITKLGSNNYHLRNAEYKAIITYADGSKVEENVTTNRYGYATIGNIYLDGVMTIELTETRAPSGYKLDNKTYTINVEGDQTNGLTDVNPSIVSTVEGMVCTRNGRGIYVTLTDEKIPYESTLKSNNDNNTKYFLTLNLYKENSHNANLSASGAKFNINIKVGEEEILNEEVTVNGSKYSKSYISIPSSIETNEGIIEITEISAPDKYELDSETKVIKFNIVDGKMTCTTDNSDITTSSSTVSDSVYKTINVTIGNKLERFGIAINKLDSENNDVRLNGSTFTIARSGDSTKTMNITDKGAGIVFPKGGTNETVRYTITETYAGKGYTKLENPIVVDVTFDENGDIADAQVVEGDGYDKDSIINIVKDGKYLGLDIVNKTKKYSGGIEIDPVDPTVEPDKFTIKFVTKDKESGEEISALYHLSLIPTNGTSKNITSGITSYVDYNTYGDIEIGFAQIFIQSGYKLDSEEKSLVINRTNENNLSFIEQNGEFDYDIDDEEKIITITNYADKDEDEGEDKDKDKLELTIETEAKYEGLTFNVTSAINDNKTVITGYNGMATTNLNEPSVTTVEYNINSVNMPYDCAEIPTVKMEIGYDAEGLIQTAQITEGQDIAEIIGEYVGLRKIQVKINITEEDKTPDGEEVPEEYRYEIVYVKQDAKNNEIKLANVDFEIDITKETGTHKIHNVTTDNYGKATDRYLTTYGETTYVITETATAEGYVLDEEPKTIVLNKTDKNKAEIESVSDGLNVIISEKSKQIIVTLTNNVDTEGNTEEGNETLGYAGLVIDKTDSSDSFIKIPNTSFSIYDETENKTYSTTTNDEGYAKVLIPMLKEDTERIYTIREVSVPNGYVQYTGDIKLKVRYNSDGVESASVSEGDQYATVTSTDKEGVNVRVANDRTEYIAVEEELKPYNVNIVKVDENNIELTKEGAKLKVDISNSIGLANITKTDVTGEDGVIAINDINGFGDIKISITEIEAPENMKLETDTKWITLHRSEATGSITHTASENVFYDIDNENRIVTVYVTNTLEDNLFTIVINKVDSTDEGIAGVEFELTLPDGSKEEKIATIETGFGCITDLPMPNAEGEYIYKLKETKTAEGYKLLTDEIELKVTFEEIDGSMCITKVTENSDNCNLINTQYINMADGTISKTKTENTTGEITTKNCFELDVVNDTLEPFSIQIETVDKDDNTKKLKDAVYKVEIKDEDGKVLKTVNSTDASNENGIIDVTEIKCMGRLTITITQTKYPTGYRNESDGVTVTKTFTIERNSENGEITAVDGIEDTQIDNEKQIVKVTMQDELRDGELTIEINKKSTDGAALENAEFSLVPVENGEEKTAIEMGATDSTGKVSKKIGLSKESTSYTYKLKETTAPKGYKKIEDKTIEITAGIRADGNFGPTAVTVDGVTQTITNDKVVISITNEEIENFKVEIETVNKDNTDQKLSGATYKVVVKDLDENKVIKEIEETSASDALGIILIDEIEGVGNIEITIEEITYPTGYEATTNGATSKTIKISRSLDDGTITAVDGIEDAQIDNTNNKVSVIIENEAKKPILELTIHKIDSETREPLSNAKFKIGKQSDTNDEYVELTPTDSNGETKVELTLEKKVGTYTYNIIETEAPAGYKNNVSTTTLQINVIQVENGSYEVNLVYESSINQTDKTTTGIIGKLVEEGKYDISIENEKVVPFNIELITQDNDTESTETIANAKYNIVIRNKFDNTEKEFKDLTSDEAGKIITSNIDGVGDIEISITQVDIPVSYILDDAEKVIKIQRNLHTGDITLVEVNGNNIEVTSVDNNDADSKKINITMKNEIMKTYVDLEMAKVDRATQYKLKGAEFEITLPDGVLTDDGSNKMNVCFETAESIIAKLPLPKETGVFKYTIEETKAPIGYRVGYRGKTAPIVLNVTVEKENHVFVAKGIEIDKTDEKAYNDVIRRIATIQNNCLMIGNEQDSENGNYKINVTLNNLSYETDTVFKFDIEANSGEFASSTITSKRGGNIQNLMGTGKITVTIYYNEEKVGNISYDRDSGTEEISNIEIVKFFGVSQKYQIEADVTEDSKNVNIKIQNNTIEVQSPVYSVSEEEKIIYGISPDTTVATFASNISANNSYTVIDANGSSTSSNTEGGLKATNTTDNLIGTGSKLKIGNTTYTLIVKGDINGDGKVTITDVTKVNLDLIKIKQIEEKYYRIAADTNFNKEITITDLVQVRLASIKMIEL